MSRVLRVIAAVILSATMHLTPASAAEAGWQVVESTGTVRTKHPAGAVQPISTQEFLLAGSVLTTGADGRVVLIRNEQEIIVGPNSRMALPAQEESGKTRILQDIGTLLFKVDKRKEKHFTVETPVIAAVVKGTTFTVTAGVDAHAVHVAEGAVEVSSANGVAREMVTAGKTARILKSRPDVIMFNEAADGSSEDGSARRATPVKKATLEVSEPVGGDALDYEKLTNGLAQAVNNTPAGDNARGLSVASERVAQNAGNEIAAAARAKTLREGPDAAGRAERPDAPAANSNAKGNSGNASGKGNSSNASSNGNSNANANSVGGGANASGNSANGNGPNGNGNVPDVPTAPASNANANSSRNGNSAGNGQNK